MKKTKVKFKFNVKENLEKVKNAYGKVKTKIKENVKSGGLKSLNKQSIKYYSLLAIMLIVAFVSTYANIRSYKEATKEKYTTYTKDNEKHELESTKKEDNKEEKKIVEAMSPQYTTAESSISCVAKKDKNASKLPVDGTIKREYSMDKVIYYESLEVWKTHSGVDIVCDENSAVIAVLEGKVIGIYNDGIYGYSVVIESEEYKCIYSSLLSDINVTIGKTVKVGEKIGYAGECGAEKELGAHVHFEVMKNGEYVNPEVLGIK